MASGFIYLIILGMWAAYFVPRWISNHEENSGKRAEKFNSAMRSVTQPEQRRAQAEDKLTRKSKIRNRRIAYSIILIALITTSIFISLGSIAPTLIAIPLSALFIYTVHVRRQVVAAQLKQRRLNALERISAASVINEPTEQIQISSREDFEDSYKEHWIPLLERTDSAGVVIIPKGERRESWEPRHVPKPTYIDAPKAVVPKRIIDLTVPGSWIESQRVAEEDLIMDSELFDQEVLEDKSRNRAANE